MPAHISLITLGVADVAKATTFYERLGLTKSKESQESISFFQAGPVARAEASGARVLKPAAKTFWGGYNGYFARP